jgi:hypothetical protein
MDARTRAFRVTDWGEFIRAASALVGASATGLLSDLRFAAPAPTSPVAFVRCDSYALPVLLARLSTALDKLDGIRALVASKTITVKANTLNVPTRPAAGLPSNPTYKIRPNAPLALAILLDAAWQRRPRFVESTFQTVPAEEFFASGGRDLRSLDRVKAEVESEDTQNLDRGAGTPRRRCRLPGISTSRASSNARASTPTSRSHSPN